MRKKALSLGIILILSVLFYNQQPKVLAVGQVPSECIGSYLSTDNPKTDHCNAACNRSDCITYCKNSPNGTKIKISGNVNKIKVVYKFGGNMGIHISIPELGIYNKNLDCYSGTCKNSFTVKQFVPANSILTIYVTDRDGKSLGFRAPSNDNKCGEDNICSPVGGTYDSIDINDLLSIAHRDNFKIISKECWADTPIGDADFDFDDMQFIIAGKLEAICGDGIIEQGEQCDDGNTQSGDGCSATCQKEAVCGNGVVEKGEQCDDGNTQSGDGCSATCQKEAVCGNGVVEKGEQCDDGNTQSGDGCSATCQKEAVCGNGVVEKGEQCDDGNTQSGDGCSATCQKEVVCGNGVVEKGEGCDDGNTQNGDGCSATCKVEVNPKDTAGGILTFLGHIIMQVVGFFAKLF